MALGSVATVPRWRLEWAEMGAPALGMGQNGRAGTSWSAAAAPDLGAAPPQRVPIPLRMMRRL
ncbi:hypothetical protein ACP4OV_021834 [Aristida adscensionis]